MLKKILITGICFFCLLRVNGQLTSRETKADSTSLELYNSGSWRELLKFSKTVFANGTDFPLLRMRAGYSAFVLGNYSECLVHYKKALEKDPSNEIAIYYCYLSNLLLNNDLPSRFYSSKLPQITRDNEKIKRFKVSSLQAEYSVKKPTNADRGTAQYKRIGIKFQPGFRTEITASAARYRQLISEPSFTAVSNNENIDINQKELYGRLAFSATCNLTLTAAFHYLYTPFNNFIYKNKVIMAAIKYHTPYVNIQLSANLAHLADSSFNQYDGIFSTYPLGNQKIYTISRISFGNDFTFSQVAGFGITRYSWIEGNIVAGSYHKLIENDGLYVYNDIDRKKFRSGITLYALLFRRMTASVNYTFERKLKIFSTNNFFNQNSINGSLTWNF